MTFAENSSGGNYSSELRAAIGAVNGSITSLGYIPCSKIENKTYANNYGVQSSTSPGTVSSVAHATLVCEADGSDPSKINPYQTAYFWRRTA